MGGITHWFWELVPGNPILQRTVGSGSRRLRHLWVRMGYLGALVLLVLLGLTTGGGMSSDVTLTELAKAGTKVFAFIAYGQVVLICLLAPLFMAGAIAAEQSGKTFDIMLTTPLTNLQVVLGLLLGRLFFVMALLLSGLPLFSVLLIFGGVPISAVFASFATAALSGLLMGSVAIALAVLRIGGRKAVVVFVIATAGYLVGSYALDALVLRRLAATGATTVLTPLHPMLVLETYLNRANYRPPGAEEVANLAWPARMYLSRPLATFCTLSAGLSFVLLLWCGLRVRSVGQSEGTIRRWLAKKLRLRGGDGADRRRKPRTVWHNPIAWREANTRGKLAAGILARWAFVVLGLAAGAVLLGLYHYQKLPNLPGSASHEVFRNALLTLLLLEVSVIALVALYMSAGSVSREREDKTLDLMLTTPITPRYYVWGKLRGLVSFLMVMLVVPVATLGMVSLYTMWGLWRQWPTASVTYVVGTVQATYELMLFEAPLLLLLTLAPFTAFCVVVGMNWSIKSQGVLSAVMAAMGVIAGLTLVLGFCGLSAARNIPYVGPVINCFSPVTNLVMILNPWETVSRFVDHPVEGRAWLLFGAAASAIGYGSLGYALLSNMVKGFDHTVRRLSGGG
ncbi:MAG: ABC transporter permease subunit [Phycisphaeraceae bacterium]|nr:ABC transporter permease subunit [Phycisphaeraceae bacterium]